MTGKESKEMDQWVKNTCCTSQTLSSNLQDPCKNGDCAVIPDRGKQTGKYSV